MSTPLPMPPVCLSISANDSSGVSLGGADIKTFTGLGTFGAWVTTGCVARNFTNVIDVQPINESLVREQLETLAETLPVVAVKVGLCPTAAIVKVVARWLRERPNLPVVVDPVITQQAGIPNLQPEVITALRAELLPRATLATPNRFEAALLAEMDEVLTTEGLEEAAKRINESCGCPVIVTGGGLGDEIIDVYHGLDGQSHFAGDSVKRDDKVVGVGCTYAAAITAQLARGEGLRESIWAAKDYVGAMIRSAPYAKPGSHTPICHCTAVENLAEGEGIGVSTRSYRRG